jgi:hypothetical protein
MSSVIVARRRGSRPLALAIRASAPALFLLIIGAACWSRQNAVQTGAAPARWRTLEGSWTSAGTRTSLHLGSDHRASIVHLNGSLLLTGENTPGVVFRGEFVGFTDTQSGMVGRAVWTDDRGDQVFSDLKGEWVGTGNRVVGTFLGGTGRFALATGEYEFQWRDVLTAEDGAVGDRTEHFKGWVRMGERSVQ